MVSLIFPPLLTILSSILLSLVLFCPADLHAIPKAKTTKKIIRKKAKPQTQSTTNKFDVGIGGGMFNIYPPQPTLQLSLHVNDYIDSSVEAGYFTYRSDQLSATGTYFGIDGKYHPWLDNSFFFGLGAGLRSITIITKSQFNVNGIDNEVEWTRSVTQTIITPRIGWMKITETGSAFVFSLGVVVPSGSKVTTSEDPKSIDGLPPEEFERERKNKREAVTAVTNSILPLVEIKYSCFFDWF